MKIYKKTILSSIIITIVLCFYFIKSVNASNGRVELSSNKNDINIEEKIVITMSINTQVAALNCNIEFDNTKLEYITGPKNTNVVDNRIIFLWYDESGGSGKTGELGKFKFKAKTEGFTEINVNGEFYNGEGNLIETNFYNTQINIKEASSESIQEGGTEPDNPNLNLENLAVENVLVYPPFDLNILNYNIEISNDIDNLNILAIPQNQQSKVEIVGNENLKEGQNKIIINVISENREKREYLINVYKRNFEEEQTYIENKKNEQEQLEQIYQTEKLYSGNLENQNKEYRSNAVEEVREKIYIGVISIAIIISLLMIVFVVKNKKRK